MLRGLDILVLLKIVAKAGEPWTQMGLAKELGMSSQSVHAALERSGIARLYSANRKAVRNQPLYEALFYGGRYFLAIELGSETRGLPTATGGPALRDVFIQIPHATPVWPDPKGTIRGLSVEPLHPSVPMAARADERLYRLLSLFDSLRIGDARERTHASAMMRAELGLA